MKSIGEFFARIKNKQTEELRLRAIIQEIMKKYLGIDVSADFISFSIKTVAIKNLSQAEKSMLFTKMPALIKEINEKVPSRAIENIKLD